MNSLRLWILTSALGCFAAGMTSGLVLPDVLQARADALANDRDEAYVRQFVADFGLDRRQEMVLRAIRADRRQKELAALRSAGLNELPPRLQAQILEARRRETERIRMLLRPDQQVSFDKEARPDENR